MKTFLARIWTVSAAVLLAFLFSPPARAAEEELQPPRPRPNMEELRERLRTLSPEERQKMMREFRERRGPGGTNRSEWESLREELRKLPPEKREERLRELRQRLEEGPPEFRVLSPEERETKRQQMKSRVATQISVLRAKKAEGTLTEIEARRLERMELMATRLEQGTVLGPRRPNPNPSAGLPPPKRPETNDGNAINPTGAKPSPPSPPPSRPLGTVPEPGPAKPR
jgi:hypothetical protein